MAPQAEAARVLVAGAVNGRLPEFFAKVKKLNAKYGPFSVLLLTGNLFGAESDDDDDISALLKDEVTIPIMTYAVMGDRALPPRVRERVAARSGEVCNNLVILAGHGILQTSEGVKVAYISGRYAAAQPQVEETDPEAGEPSPDTTAAATTTTFDRAAISDIITQAAAENEKLFQKTLAQPSIDILLTFDWPYGVAGAPTHAACNKISYVCAAVMPRYHFAAGEGTFYERQPWKYSDRITIANGSAAAPHYTRFIGLGSVNESQHGKQRWFYAMNVHPLQKMSQGASAPGDLPDNCTPNPLFRFGRVPRALDTAILPKVLLAIDSNGADNTEISGSGRGQQGKRHAPPPLDYICHGCNHPGHWAPDCPTRDHQKRRRGDDAPPPGYVCHGCKQPGHWREECPAASGSGGSRGEAAADALSKCWFCLANPDVDQNLMVAIGDEAYIAMAKGALVVGRAPDDSSSSSSGFEGHISPIPGGGHILVVPIVHTDSLRRAREGTGESDKSLCAEIDRWVAAVTALFAEFDCTPLTFETSRCLPHVHTALQMIPVPREKADSVRATLSELCMADGLDIASSYPAALRGGYVAFGDDLYVQIPKGSRKFNLQLGRKLAATILGVPERESWTACTVPEGEEARERDRFIAAFSKHDFTR
ncbi:hypothetical protein GGF46_003141 [Coemansia sp. RSA 552]|nr:hypothetical protein GGF46_003141 [Coemansia sp. RSA 552]